jgi:uncharacterized membrane protein YeaQ/YmgE (transglycosylase-associated protein family)
MLLTYAMLGILAGWSTDLLLPKEASGNRWLACLIGLDSALIGSYLSTSWLGKPGQGITIFVVLLVTFILMSVYHTAFQRVVPARSMSVVSQ